MDVEHNAEKVQEILNRIMQRIVSVITLILLQVYLLSCCVTHRVITWSEYWVHGSDSGNNERTPMIMLRSLIPNVIEDGV